MSPDRLDATFAALADPTRRAILARLASGEASVTELARAVRDEPARDLEAPQGARARRADLARPRRTAAAASARGRPLADANEWLEQYRQSWEAYFQRLDALLDEMKTEAENPWTHQALEEITDEQYS